MENKLEHVTIIRDEILTNPDVPGLIVWEAAKVALEDDYLYDLMIDWMKETNSYIQNELLQEILNYTEEVLRRERL